MGVPHIHMFSVCLQIQTQSIWLLKASPLA